MKKRAKKKYEAMSKEDLEKERNLAYASLTRAQEKIRLINEALSKHEQEAERLRVIDISKMESPPVVRRLVKVSIQPASSRTTP